MWIKLKDQLSEVGRIIITWNGESYTISKYQKALTWRGYKLKLVNMFSKMGAWNEDVTHWMYFPSPPRS